MRKLVKQITEQLQEKTLHNVKTPDSRYLLNVATEKTIAATNQESQVESQPVDVNLVNRFWGLSCDLPIGRI